MNSKSLIICDPEEGYARALAAYIMERRELAFQVQVCESLQTLGEIEKVSGMDYLFISADWAAGERKCIQAGRKFVLQSDGGEVLNEGETGVFKYQSGEAILAELALHLEEEEDASGLLRKMRKEKGKIIGIYSPVHRIGKTTYALELGRELSAREEVLYLNMELYGGRGGIFPEQNEKSLADVLYYSRQESKNFALVLSAMALRRGTLDYIAPMPVSEDVRAVTAEEWTSLLIQIMEKSIYEVVILDLDEGLQGIYDILRLCNEVYMPVPRERTETESGGRSEIEPRGKSETEPGGENQGAAGEQWKAKIAQFEEELSLLGYEDVLRKISRKEQKE